MAVYQYYLAVVPKQGIEKKHYSTPNEIRVSTETLNLTLKSIGKKLK